MRSDPLAFLSAELDALKQQGLYRQLRVLDDEQKPSTTVDHHQRRQPLVEQLPRPDDASAAARARARGDRAARRRHRIGPHDRRHHGHPHGARATARRVQADRGGRRLPERLHRQRRHGLVDSDERRRRDLRRAEPRQHHRRLPAEPRGDQGLSAQGRRRRARRSCDRCRPAQRKLLITDGVFSMDGDLGPLPALCALAEEFGCIMMVDDAHASGVFGRNGRGTIDHFDVHGRVDVQVGTLSKAIGALGGYVAGTRALIDFLHHRARPFLFSTSHPPAVAAACIAAIDVLHGGTGAHRSAVGEHALLQGGSAAARVQHGNEREPDHAGHRRRRARWP